MKNIIFIGVCFFLFMSCKQKASAQTEDVLYTPFGNNFTKTNVNQASSMAKTYQTLKTGDTLSTKMMAKVKSVCKAKGCWMRLDLENGKEVMVKFKDYGFFMPKDIENKYVIVNGKAFVEEVSIEEQRHYAEDAGKTAKEIANITSPKKTFSFEADGVLLKP